jgi:hypothetical protein
MTSCKRLPRTNHGQPEKPRHATRGGCACTATPSRVWAGKEHGLAGPLTVLIAGLLRPTSCRLLKISKKREIASLKQLNANANALWPWGRGPLTSPKAPFAPPVRARASPLASEWCAPACHALQRINNSCWRYPAGGREEVPAGSA